MSASAGKGKATAPTLELVNSEDAVDESNDADGDFVMLQKTLSQKKRAAKDFSEDRISKVLPFAFSPNIRPLSISDLDSVVALENAAFHDAAHRATPEKVPSLSH
jgi:hypothetical protein